MLSATEKERRHEAVRQILDDENLKALLLIGDANNSYGFYGDLRYYTNNRTITYREVVVVFGDSEAVLFTTTTRKLTEIAARSFVSDCRFSEDIVADVIELFKRRRISSGRIGVNFEMLSVAWYTYLKDGLPKIEWVETHEQMMQVRFKRSQEEADIYRKGATLGDGGFEAALKVIRPGVSEYEIIAEIEYFSRARGAEEHFTQIGSGKFGFGNGNIVFYYPTHRRIEVGDSLLMEITPRYEGYWTQLVRAVNVGQPNTDLEKMQTVCRDAINKGLEQFKPGKKVRDIVFAMESYADGRGYLMKAPFGHISGVDLIEGRVSPQNDMLLTPGTAVIIHPTVFTRDGKNWSFCGETYLVTQDGYERLHRTGDELVTV